MAKKHKPQVFDDAYEELIAEIITDKEPLVVVLRGHLITELLLNEILWTFHLLGATTKELNEAIDATYLRKLEAIYEAKLIQDRFYLPLRALDTIRNRLADLPLKLKITSTDEETFLTAFTEKDQADILAAKDSLKGKRKHPHIANGLLLLWAGLCALVKMYRKDRPRRFE
jgi:hypothetical protein